MLKDSPWTSYTVPQLHSFTVYFSHSLGAPCKACDPRNCGCCRALNTALANTVFAQQVLYLIFFMTRMMCLSS